MAGFATGLPAVDGDQFATGILAHSITESPIRLGKKYYFVGIKYQRLARLSRVRFEGGRETMTTTEDTEREGGKDSGF
jgi:hypothetical protein